MHYSPPTETSSHQSAACLDSWPRYLLLLGLRSSREREGPACSTTSLGSRSASRRSRRRPPYLVARKASSIKDHFWSLHTALAALVRSKGSSIRILGYVGEVEDKTSRLSPGTPLAGAQLVLPGVSLAVPLNSKNSLSRLETTRIVTTRVSRHYHHQHITCPSTSPLRTEATSKLWSKPLLLPATPVWP